MKSVFEFPHNNNNPKLPEFNFEINAIMIIDTEYHIVKPCIFS